MEEDMRGYFDELDDEDGLLDLEMHEDSEEKLKKTMKQMTKETAYVQKGMDLAEETQKKLKEGTEVPIAVDGDIQKVLEEMAIEIHKLKLAWLGTWISEEGNSKFIDMMFDEMNFQFKISRRNFKKLEKKLSKKGKKKK